MDHKRHNLPEQVAIASGVAAICLALFIPWVVAILRGDFNLNSRYISELGARGEPCEMFVRWVSFFPAGVLFLVFSFKVLRPWIAEMGGKAEWRLISFWGVGWAASAVFPCDPGCPFTGTSSQLVHGLVILPLYVFGVPCGLVLLGRRFRKCEKLGGLSAITIFTACVFFLGYLFALLGFFAEYRGLIQWTAEALFGLWVVWVVILNWNKIKKPMSKAPNLTKTY